MMTVTERTITCKSPRQNRHLTATNHHDDDPTTMAITNQYKVPR